MDGSQWQWCAMPRWSRLEQEKYARQEYPAARIEQRVLRERRVRVTIAAANGMVFLSDQVPTPTDRDTAPHVVAEMDPGWRIE